MFMDKWAIKGRLSRLDSKAIPAGMPAIAAANLACFQRTRPAVCYLFEADRRQCSSYPLRNQTNNHDIQQATGRRPAGWLGSGLQETWNTLDHLAAEGCTYVADWVNDDQPYLMDVGGKKLVSVPYSYEVNDTAAIVRSGYTPGEFERMIRDQFEALWREGEHSARVMAICLHPYVTGQPHRIRALERALDHILGFEGVWKGTGEEIARHFLDNQPAA